MLSDKREAHDFLPPPSAALDIGNRQVDVAKPLIGGKSITR
jgi:hypothetical protein